MSPLPAMLHPVPPAVLPLAGVPFRLTSSVPQLRVRPRGLGRFILSGQVPDFADPALRFYSPVGEVEVPLAERSLPRDAVRALQRRLPRGVRASAVEVDADVELSLHETIVPAAAVPRVMVMTTDTNARVKLLDDNRFEVLGCAATDCLFTLGVERRRTVTAVLAGTSAEAIATRLAANVPHGYVGFAEGSIVTVWKDAGVSEIAA